jgi:hypothetical protein
MPARAQESDIAARAHSARSSDGTVILCSELPRVRRWIRHARAETAFGWVSDARRGRRRSPGRGPVSGTENDGITVPSLLARSWSAGASVGSTDLGTCMRKTPFGVALRSRLESIRGAETAPLTDASLLPSTVSCASLAPSRAPSSRLRVHRLGRSSRSRRSRGSGRAAPSHQ